MTEFYFYNVFEYSVRLPLFSIPVRPYFLFVPSVLTVVQLWLAHSGPYFLIVPSVLTVVQLWLAHSGPYFLIVPSVLTVVQLWLAHSGLVQLWLAHSGLVQLWLAHSGPDCGSSVIGTLSRWRLLRRGNIPVHCCLFGAEDGYLMLQTNRCMHLYDRAVVVLVRRHP